MKKGILAMCLVLAACVENNNNYGYGWEYDYRDESTGLRVRYDLAETDFYPFSQINQWYIETMECTQIFAAVGPLVIILDTDYVDGIHRGMIYVDAGLILIGGQIINKIDRTIKHEFIHYLLAASGYVHDPNNQHESDLFYSCNPP